MLDRSPDTVHRRRWLILGVLCLSLVMVVIGNVSLNVAIPHLTDDLHASFSQLQWMVDAYSLLFAGLLLPAGALGDRFGRKGALQGGLAVFGLASLYASFASQPWQVIAARGVMGVAAAFIMPGTLSILANVFPPQERPKAIAIWAGVAGASVAAGLLVSGYLLEHFWWGSVFLINVPVVAFALLAGLVLLPTSKDPHRAPLDKVGALLAVAALSSLLYGFIEAPDSGWGNPEILGAIAVALVLFAGFVWWERRTADPMLDLGYFRDRRFTVGCVSIAGSFFALFGSYFLLTQYLQFVLGYGPLKAGVYALPAGVAQMVSAPPSARLVDRWGYRPILASGLALIAGGMAMLAYLSLTSPVLLLLVGLGVIGLGMGLATAPSTGAIIASLPMGKAGVGSAVNDTTRELGGALGIAVMGSLLSSRFRGDIAPAVAHLPQRLADQARHGVGPALGVAHSPRAHGLALTARHAFTNGILVAMWVAAGMAAVAMIAVLRSLPAGLRPSDGPVPGDEAPESEPEPEPVAVGSGGS